MQANYSICGPNIHTYFWVCGKVVAATVKELNAYSVYTFFWKSEVATLWRCEVYFCSKKGCYVKSDVRRTSRYTSSLSPVHTSNDVKATLSNVTSRTILSTESYVLRYCCRLWQQCRTKFRSFEKVETIWTCPICSDFVGNKRNFTINSFEIVAVFGNEVECCFDKVERCFDIVAGVTVVLTSALGCADTIVCFMLCVYIIFVCAAYGRNNKR